MRPIAIVLLMVTLLAGCSRTPEEQRIRNSITAMQQAVQAHQPRAFMSYVNADFAGQDASVDRERLANILRAEVLRNDQVNVILGPIDVQMQGSRATVHVTVTLMGGSGGPLPEHGAVYAITSGWKKDGSDWRCYNASWEQKLLSVLPGPPKAESGIQFWSFCFRAIKKQELDSRLRGNDEQRAQSLSYAAFVLPAN